MKEDNIAIRLKILVDKLGINNSQFADNCRIPRPSLSQTLSGRNKKINDQFIRQIHEAYPTLSINWLLFGEGSMWTDGEVQPIDGVNGVSSDIPSLNKSSLEPILSDLSSKDQKSEFHAIENQFVSPSGQSRSDEGKENALNAAGFTGEVADSKNVDLLLKIADLQSQIENLQKKIRKVVSVTIYYDDSTFETFSPDGRRRE